MFHSMSVWPFCFHKTFAVSRRFFFLTWMTTTKATMIAITKHETHSYYVIILSVQDFNLNYVHPTLLECFIKGTMLWLCWNLSWTWQSLELGKREEKNWAKKDIHFVHLATLVFWGLCPCPALQACSYCEDSIFLVMILPSWLQLNDPNWTD